MKRLRWLAMAHAVLALVALSAGCSGSDDPVDGGDAGITDASNSNTNADGGGIFVPGLDGGTPDSGIIPCVDGTEGCACQWAGGAVVPLRQDSCDADLLCIPWDILSQDPTLTGPVQSCVRPCAMDSDCGTNADGSPRFCRESGFTEASGAARICFDEVAEADEFCGYSKLTDSRMPGTAVETAGRMIACPGGVPCQPFSFVHVDEGICLNLCTDSDDCDDPRPYCNPNFFTATSSIGEQVPIGVCAEGQKQVGDLCGSDDPARVGFTTECDTSDEAVPNTLCLPGITIGLPSLPIPPATRGVCTTLCTPELPCQGADPELGATTCSSQYLPIALGMSNTSGVCGSGCSSFPNTCAGDGTTGAGRFCTNADGVSFGGPTATGSAFCVDVVPPELQPAVIDDGVADLDAGDDCLALDTTAVLSCPRDSTCTGIQAAGSPIVRSGRRSQVAPHPTGPGQKS